MFWQKEKSPKFIVTFEAGRLCRWMRVLGYDAVYFNKGKKRDLIIQSMRENRVILTREAGISRYSGTRMIRIKDDLVENQVRQVLKEMRLKAEGDKIFTRCVICNTPIKSVGKEEVGDRLPPYVYKTQNNFLKCPNCNKVYWKGTHYNLARKFLNERAKA